MTDGLKKDSMQNTKPMMSLIDPQFKESLAMLMTLGGFKYDFNNWKLATTEQMREYRDALERHLIARDKGELIDKDTGLPHTIAIAFNAMALNYFDLKFGYDNGNRQDYRDKLNYYKDIKNENTD